MDNKILHAIFIQWKNRNYQIALWIGLLRTVMSKLFQLICGIVLDGELTELLSEITDLHSVVDCIVSRASTLSSLLVSSWEFEFAIVLRKRVLTFYGADDFILWIEQQVIDLLCECFSIFAGAPDVVSADIRSFSPLPLLLAYFADFEYFVLHETVPSFNSRCDNNSFFYERFCKN